MDEKELICTLLSELKDNDLWFTTKNDPTMMEPGSYYILDEYGDLTDKSIKQIYKEVSNYIGDGAVDIFDAIQIWITEKLSECRIDYIDNLVTKFKDKQVVPQINAYKNPVQLSESYRTRLAEVNNKSQNLIAEKMTSSDFDAESKEGQIILRTSELFNVLSDKGYDVQLAFDNGDSQSTILLGEQGGVVNITITDSADKIKAFTSGSFELTDANLDVLTDIKEIISNI